MANDNTKFELVIRFVDDTYWSDGDRSTVRTEFHDSYDKAVEKARHYLENGFPFKGLEGARSHANVSKEDMKLYEITTKEVEIVLPKARKFRHKPLEVVAQQWNRHGDHPAVKDDGLTKDLHGPRYQKPKGLIKTLPYGSTTAQNVTIYSGDWIITDQYGHHSVIRSQDFEQLYDLAEDK